MVKFYNQTSTDKSHRFTLQIPLYCWMALVERTRKGTRYNGNKGVYLRELLENDLLGDYTITQKKYEDIVKSNNSDGETNLKGLKLIMFRFFKKSVDSSRN